MVDVPNLDPLDAPQTVEERRARQRLHVKRTYYKKLMEMQSLRETMEGLEAEFARLELQKRMAEEGTASGDDRTTPSAIASPKSEEYESAKQRFNEIVDIKAQLRKENEALQRAISEHRRYALKAASWIRLGQFVSSEREGGTDTLPIPERAVHSLTLTSPLSVEKCQEIAHQTLQGIQRFSDNPAFLSTGVSLFGWRDKRIRFQDRVAFSLTKDFRNISALELSQRTWVVVGGTNGLSRLYSASMNVSVVTIQSVDDDNEIKLRVMTTADGRVRVFTLFLVSRLAIAEGYVIIIRSLDHTQYVELGESTPEGVEDYWVDYHNWTIFESQGEHCRLEFGGEVQSNAVAGSDMWMLEVLLVALRWESTVLEPVFRICQD